MYADLLDAAAIQELVAEYRPGAIVHLAAMFAPASYRNPRLARKVNVQGTTNLVDAAKALPEPPLFLTASSAAVYGSGNPYRHSERITPDTPVNPVDQYGEDKVLTEAVVRESTLPHAMWGSRSPTRWTGPTPSAAKSCSSPATTPICTPTASSRTTSWSIMEAVGIGRLGASASLPGDPDDEWGWTFTGFFDTTKSQALPGFQQHAWPDTVGWVAESMGRRRTTWRALGPVIRPVMRLFLAVPRRVERRGRYADPWRLIGTKYGPDVLAPTNF